MTGKVEQNRVFQTIDITYKTLTVVAVKVKHISFCNYDEIAKQVSKAFVTVRSLQVMPERLSKSKHSNVISLPTHLKDTCNIPSLHSV